MPGQSLDQKIGRDVDVGQRWLLISKAVYSNDIFQETWSRLLRRRVVPSRLHRKQHRSSLEEHQTGGDGDLGGVHALGSPFAFSQKNRFAAVGCGAIARMALDGSTIGGCLSICSNHNEAID
ncbi:hypothetical protein TIFTF001_050644 [Ficus carica]|uniref:Uncharacterized protein n=1 Tax=Ficus carica TaxID=3494 RepID=A0AA87Z8L8_FICCA|nr:hypothetical protein TIFTF001_050644 [Ficus carica]